MFAPKQTAEDHRGTRVERIICLDVGKDRKAAFVSYCASRGIKQTSMIKQMMDYCMTGEMTK